MLNLWFGSERSKALRVQGHLVIVVALLVAAFGVFGTFTVNAATVNVSPSGTDSPTCGGGTPCLTIGQAITNAAAGDTVLVAAGTYTGVVTFNLTDYSLPADSNGL